MSVSASMQDHLGGNVTRLIAVWTIIASDGTVAAYAAHTRDVTFNSQVYKASPVEPSRFSLTLGVTQANNAELFGIFDDIITEADVQGGRWKGARIQFDYIAYDFVTGAASSSIVGSVGKMRGVAGKVDCQNGTYQIEFRSLSDLLQQEIGELTSPLDRNARPDDLGIDMTPFTFARNVTTSTDRRNFTIDGTAEIDDYFAYGRVLWTGGANDGLQMEIKGNIANAIELQLPMRSAIAPGDTVTLYAGYDGTRDQTRDKFSAMEAFNGEPDLPGIAKGILSYPE